MAETEEQVEKRFARAEDLGPEGEWIDELQLPFSGDWVNVRAVDSILFSDIVQLPDLFGYRELVASIRKLTEGEAKAEGETEPEPGPEEEALEGRTFIREQQRYFATVVHVAVVNPDAPEVESTCTDCGLEHPPHLWTVAQARRLHPIDLEAIAASAMRGRMGKRYRPFSEATADSDTPLSVNAGE